MDNNAVAVVLVAFFSVGGPLLALVINARIAGSAKQRDWDRQDEVAERAAAAAKASAVAATRVVKATEAQAVVLKDMAETQERTAAKVEIVHTLVNSNLTAAMQAELATLERELALLDNLPPSDKTLAAVAVADARAAELRATLTDRLAQNDAADIQIAAEADRKQSMGP